MFERRDDLVRFIVNTLRDRGMDLKAASLAIGKNQSYLHQFTGAKASPRVLPEDVRTDLARIMGLDESALRLKPKDRPEIPKKVNFNMTHSGHIRAAHGMGAQEEAATMANIRYELILAITVLPDEALPGVQSMLDLLTGKAKRANKLNPQTGSEK